MPLNARPRRPSTAACLVRIAALGLLSAAAGCAAPLSGDWILARVDDAPALVGAPVRLQVVDGRVRGSDGCNAFTAALEGDGSQGRILGFETTLRACVDVPLRNQAILVSAIFASTPRYERSPAGLRLTSAVGSLLYAPAAAAPRGPGESARLAGGGAQPRRASRPRAAATKAEGVMPNMAR